MTDAWGKIPEGILAGHTSSYGDFDECVQIQVDSISGLKKDFQQFDGLYCTTHLVDFNTSMSMTPIPVGSITPKADVDINNLVQKLVSLEELIVSLGIFKTSIKVKTKS